MKKGSINNGDKFGRLTAIEYIYKHKDTRVKCLCDCGNVSYVSPNNLKSGGTKSCGCLKREILSTHKETQTRLHNIWSKMKYRCNNSNYYAYSYYGGKGVKVCKEWTDSFEIFKNWSLSNGYTDELTIDRIDSNGNYEPSNCRWVTHSYNSIRANALFVVVDGIEDSLIGWSRRLGVSVHLITDKYKEFGEDHVKNVIKKFYETGSNEHLYKRKFYANNKKSTVIQK